MQSAHDLIEIFNNLFIKNYGAELVAGGSEPIYLPSADADGYHRIVFTRDYFSSALHEISHWCIAGDERRRQVDYSYWYVPDGRNELEQQNFEQVEVKPQALEWIFAAAAGTSFRISADNLSGVEIDTSQFFEAVKQQVCDYLRSGLPPRAEQFRQALLDFYEREEAFSVFCKDLLAEQVLQVEDHQQPACG